MKTTVLKILLVTVGIVAIAATTAPLRQTKPLKIENTEDAAKLVIQSPQSPSNNIAEIYTGSTLAFAIAPTAAGTRTNLGLQAGTCVMTSDGSITQSFGTVYSAAPVVLTTQRDSGAGTTTTTNRISVTTSNFVLRTSLASQTNAWLAVGTPAAQSGP